MTQRKTAKGRIAPFKIKFPEGFDPAHAVYLDGDKMTGSVSQQMTSWCDTHLVDCVTIFMGLIKCFRSAGDSLKFRVNFSDYLYDFAENQTDDDGDHSPSWSD